ncbi:hypothetical protein BT96DRAFT_838809 [Gymnopus androsaceus JB14]|uniref:Uncharacterized protein n=1 Tax=Gymnopus androsaceus JB14 TaxID=1447944 RepID=A0A6A4GLY3_9AGAR|nr:hypothetical protein BT96DRAFT_838809 [Gymnopus androsaceus JB14]
MQEVQTALGKESYFINRFGHAADYICIQIHNISNKTINSSTRLLLAEKKIVTDLQMPAKQIPCNVRTHWNSTFNKVNMAIQYRTPLNSLINDSDNGLTCFSLFSTEWII